MIDERPKDARFPEGMDQSIFNGLVPDGMTASTIERRLEGGYKLVATTSANDMQALELHKRLEQEHGEILHQMLSAFRDDDRLGWNMVGINLYFTKA